MKSRTLKIGLLVLMLAMESGHAADNQPQANSLVETWSQWTTTVKVKVKEWLGWETPAPQQANQPQAPATGNQPAQIAKPANLNPIAPAANQTSLSPTPRPQAQPNKFTAQNLFVERAQRKTPEELKKAQQNLKAKALFNIAQPARAGSSALPKSKVGVPQTQWQPIKVSKRIPRLDIGTEPTLSKNDFIIDDLTVGVDKPAELKKLDSAVQLTAQETNILQAKVEPVLPLRQLQAQFKTVGQPMNIEAVNKITYQISAVPEVKELPYKPLSEEHLKMVAALILFDAGDNCPIIMGMFQQLKQVDKTKIEATHYLGACADQLKMHQSSFDNLSQVVTSEDKDFASEALELLALELPLIYEKDFYRTVSRLKNLKSWLKPTSQDLVYYRAAKGAFRAKDYKSAMSFADQVPPTSDYLSEAQFLSAMNSFALNDKVSALKKLNQLNSQVQGKTGVNNNLRALININLGRMNFANKNYDKALEHYMQIPKDHALWVQGLIEQGWTQLAAHDYSGAIGNMYSLHSPYFKAVYQPESFVVRAIGYLNICQYGDAYRTISFLEKDYRQWYDKTHSYLASHSEPTGIYQSVKSYIRGKSDQDFEGVPFQVWREMARRKDFLNLQLALNDKQDEGGRYNGVNEKIKSEKVAIRVRAEQAKKRFDEMKNKISAFKISKDKQVPESWRENLRNERDLTVAYRFKLAILEQSRQGYLDFQKSSQAKLDSETQVLSKEAGQILLGRAKDMQSDMSRVLENNEFLRYEVFAGSGENIRYQVAGGEVGSPNRIPAHIKPAKMLNWSFDGEFWEDEIGSYRSSLENVCPSNARDQAQNN